MLEMLEAFVPISLLKKKKKLIYLQFRSFIELIIFANFHILHPDCGKCRVIDEQF